MSNEREAAKEFTKRPVKISARKWQKDGDHDHVTSLPGELWGETHAERYCKHCGMNKCNHGMIKTLEGGHIVCPGDWIIKGVKGEYYPCKPDIFDMTYTPAQQSAPEPGWDSGYESGYNDAIAQIKSAPAQPLMKRIAELEAELAALKEIPEQAEIAGYKASDGSLMSAESGALFAAKYMDKYEPLITLSHHNAIVSSLRAKAAVPEGLLDRIDSAITAFTSGRASMHVPPEANDVDMVLAECWKMVKSMLAAAPAQPQSDCVMVPRELALDLIALADMNIGFTAVPIEKLRALMGGEA